MYHLHNQKISSFFGFVISLIIYNTFTVSQLQHLNLLFLELQLAEAWRVQQVFPVSRIKQCY